MDRGRAAGTNGGQDGDTVAYKGVHILHRDLDCGEGLEAGGESAGSLTMRRRMPKPVVSARERALMLTPRMIRMPSDRPIGTWVRPQEHEKQSYLNHIVRGTKIVV